ncbi:MAG: ribosomal protein S18-alanine N-acetyltransferase [Halioglobus sp.]
MLTCDVREAVESDVAHMAALDSAVGMNPWSAERHRAVCAAGVSDSESALVAHAGATLVGFIVMSCIADEGEIRNLAVAPARQRQGVGRSLVRAALLRMVARGVNRCYLEVRASNRRAQNLYTAVGFHTSGERRDYYTTPEGREDALLMALNIQDYIRRKQ